MTLPELEQWLLNADLPPVIQLDSVTVAETQKLVKSHLLYLKSNPGKRVFMPYYDRLLLVKKIIERT